MQASSLVIFAVLPATLAVAQDDCHDATPISDNGTFVGDTSGATPDGTASCAMSNDSPDVWYLYTAQADGILHVDTCSLAGYDTALSAHSGCPGTAENELACNDDTCGLQSVIEFVVDEGESYYLRVSGWDGASGPYQMSVILLGGADGDDCEDAVPVTVGTWGGDTTGASNDGGASCGESATSADVWFAYTAEEDESVFFETCGANWDTVLSVHTGCPGHALNQIACNDDFCSFQSRVLISAEAGETYFVRVAGFQGATGVFALTVATTEPPAEGADILIGNLTDMQSTLR